MKMNDSKFVVTHSECENLLPAYINGHLAPETALAVVTHIENCNSCREALQVVSHLRNRLATEPDAMTLGLQQKRLEANFKHLWDRIEPPKKKLGPHRWQIAVMISVIALVSWQSFFISPPASSPRLRVLFADELSQSRFQALLQAAGAQIIGGPNERGVFTLQVKDPVLALRVLRNQPLVRFAEMAAY